MQCGKILRKTLVVLDFDQTITNRGTISGIGKLAEYPETIETLHRTLREKGWTAYMKMALLCIQQRRVPVSTVRMHLLKNVKLTDGMPDLLTYLRNHPYKYDVILISDNNSFFTDWVLSKYGYKDLFDKIFTNPAEINFDDSITIGDYSLSSTCTLCPKNMCKGRVLQEYAGLAGGKNPERRKYDQVAYIGDGLGDLCPAKSLSPEDIIFARNGFELAQLAVDSPDVTARIKVWNSAVEVVDLLKHVTAKGSLAP